MLRTSNTELLGQLHDVQGFPGFRGKLYSPISSIAPLMEAQSPLLILRCSYFAILPLLRTYANRYPTHACKRFCLQFRGKTDCKLATGRNSCLCTKLYLVRSAKGFFHLSLAHQRQYTDHNGPGLV